MEANSTGGQGSRRAVAPGDNDDPVPSWLEGQLNHIKNFI